MRIKIQQKELADHFLPYPYFIEKGGLISRQDFWQGNPYKLLGFSKKPKAGSIDLTFKDFWKKPGECVGMFPVFSTAQDTWTTHKIAIASFETLFNG